MGILKGSVVFFADLMRAIDLPCKTEFMAVSSYGAATKTSGVVNLVKDLTVDITGMHVLVSPMPYISSVAPESTSTLWRTLSSQ